MKVFDFARKAALFVMLYAAYFTRRIARRDYVVVTPEPPAPRYSLHKLLLAEGLAVAPRVRAGTKPLAIIRHADLTWDEEADPSEVNGRCRDISKSEVDRVFGEVFGYRTRLDPTRHSGRAVIKTEVNCGGVGRFIDLPVSPDEVREGFIYQKLVDNEIEPGVVLEYRVSIVGGEITDLFMARRAIDKRLAGRGSGGMGSKICKADEVFSADDQAKIREFCRRLGLDFGELDILPDVPEGRIYILDANKTPTFLMQASAIRPARVRLAFARARALRRFLETRAG